MNKLLTLPFLVRPDPISKVAVIHPDSRMIFPESDLMGRSIGVIDPGYDQQNGIIGVYLLCAHSTEICFAC